MKILFLYDGRRRAPSQRLEIDFIHRLKDFCEFYVYGYKERELNGEDISPIEFDRKAKVKDIIKELKPDLLLLPSTPIALLFKGIKTKLNIPKVLFEVDYYAVKDKHWYKKSHIDLIVNRGIECVEEETKVKSVWLPLSAQEQDFYTDPNSNYLDNRLKKVVFVGGGRYSLNKLYFHRQVAIRTLESMDLLDYIGHVGYERYPTILKSYLIGLSDGFPPLNTPAAKTFELMASGTAVLSTYLRNKEVLFGEKQCYFEYNLGNVQDIAKKVLNDMDKIKETTMNALEVINKHHLHKHRIIEFYDILNALIAGREIPKKWGL